MDAVGIGVLFLVAAFLNYRYIERVMRWNGLPDDKIRWLATNPVGNKIGGTVILAVIGVMLIMAGLARIT